MAVSSTDRVSFKILPEDKIVHASHDKTILEALIKARINIDHSCGGMGSCGTCRIFVVEGLEKFEERNETEQEIADDRGFAPNERLSCQNLVKDHLVLKKPY